MTKNTRDMNRLYVVESTPTNTGAMADHCWRLKPSELEVFAKQLANRLGAESSAAAGTISSWSNIDTRWVDHLVQDLQAHRGATIVIAGREATPLVHALAHAINSTLGNIGKTVFYSDPLEANSLDQRQSLQELINDIDGGRVEILAIVSGNPVYNTPADLKLDKTRMFKVSKLRVHLSMFRDETSELCHWHIPESHYLEAWSDARTFDGTTTIVQPLIEPLYQSKSAHEFLAVFTAQFDKKGYDIVRDYTAPMVRQMRSGRAAIIRLPRALRRSHHRPSRLAALHPIRTRQPLLYHPSRRSLKPHGASGCTTGSFQIQRFRRKQCRSDQAGQIRYSQRTDSRRLRLLKLKLSFAPIRRFTMAGLPTTAGCKNCQSP